MGAVKDPKHPGSATPKDGGRLYTRWHDPKRKDKLLLPTTTATADDACLFKARNRWMICCR